MCDLLLTSRPFRFKKFKKSSKNGRESVGSVAIAGTGKNFSLSADESSQPGGTRGLQVRILSGTFFLCVCVLTECDAQNVDILLDL